MSFLDLYQGDQEQAARMQPNEGTRLPSTFEENFHAAWSSGLLFSQSVARENARAGVLNDYIGEIRQKTGQDLSNEIRPIEGGMGPDMFEQANARVAKLKENYPDLDLDPLSNEEIDKRALTKAQAAHRNYETLQQGEKTWGGSFGSGLGSLAAGAADPINIIALPIAPEAAGIGILATALRWGALAGLSQAVIEFQSDEFKEQVQPGYMESGAPLHEIAGAFVGGAVVGGGIKALGNAWTRVKTGQWPTSVRDAGNVIESEANVASTNPFPGAEGEVAHRDALVKTIDDILAGRPVDVGARISPEQAAHFEAYHGSPHDFERFSMEGIGSGEGAQAFGHGLYFAESEGVARSYRDALEGHNTTIDGKPYNPYNALHVAAAQVEESGSREAAIKEIKETIARDPGDPSGHFPRVLALLESDRELPKIEGAGGNLYKVRITADPEKFINYGKKLDEQPEAARPILKRIMESKTGLESQYLIHKITAAESKELSEAGVPGVRYFDGQSRAAEEGTRNYVVFNDKDIEITHKNGKPVNAEIKQDLVDKAMGLPPKQAELPLAPEAEPMAPKRPVEQGPQPVTQTAEEMNKTLTAPDHQDAIRADIDRERALGDVKVPGVDENGNHTMLSVDKAMDEVDAYKQAAEQIQACANPPAEAAE